MLVSVHSIMKLPKIYEPNQYEEDIYSLWEKLEAFKPRGEGESYSLVVPPPNANGNLHLGHGLSLALEDILARYHRLKGDKTLFVPGADHAGFETWVVYEKKLAAEGKSRFDFTRRELYEQVWNFVAQNQQNFEKQFRQLGASVDWSHFTFTLDDKIIGLAYSTFKKMWDEGLIYRSQRLVNYCTYHGTSFADIEVEYREEKGSLWYIRYPFTDNSGDIVVATTRPETMLGDTGIAVHPADPRYQSIIGKSIRLPLSGREIPIVQDSFVDSKYGTGAVKLTPAHDPSDYEVAKKHDLPSITVIDYEGKMKNVDKSYRDLNVLDARKKIVNDLTAQGYIVKIEDINHNVGHCYKCGTIIEPMLKEQWFVNMQPLAKNAIDALKNNKITFYPQSKKVQLIAYLEGLKDWNISRQIAWGIPIPAFVNVDDPDDWIYDERVNEEIITVDNKIYRRDPDVFDTWFSSSSWPWAVLGYPKSEDYEDFYPLNVMETGFDILMPWVSRMLMMGLYITGDVPFEKVYLHGLIQDEHGQKMSKSKGNVIDPILKVKTFGSDAFRIGLICDESPGSNRPYDESKVIGGRNFCNKLWNIARYIESTFDDQGTKDKNVAAISLADNWVLDKLQQSTDKIALCLDKCSFSEAYETLRHFVWDDFADWYIEASKVQTNKQLLRFVLEATLKLTHPFAPFVTETIWQTIATDQGSLLATSMWPEIPLYDRDLAATFEDIRTIVFETRNLVTALKLSDTKLHYLAPVFVSENAAIIESLTGVKTVTEVQTGAGLKLITTPYDCWLEVSPQLLIQHVAILKDKRKAQDETQKKLSARLSNTKYISQAPPSIVDETKLQLAQTETLISTIDAEIERFTPKQVVNPNKLGTNTPPPPTNQDKIPKTTTPGSGGSS